ncbi:hypothetical protein KW882_05565 [Vibrio parahaemolyticus]
MTSNKSTSPIITLTSYEDAHFLTNGLTKAIDGSFPHLKESGLPFQMKGDVFYPLTVEEENLISKGSVVIPLKDGSELELQLGYTILSDGKKYHFLLQNFDTSEYDTLGCDTTLSPEEINKLCYTPCCALAEKVNGIVYWSGEPRGKYQHNGKEYHVYHYGVMVPFDALTKRHKTVSEWKAELESFSLDLSA